MLYVKIEPMPNGAHDNMRPNATMPLLEGWAVVPDDMTVPESFPFVRITAEDGMVTGMTPLPVPPIEPDPVISVERINFDETKIINEYAERIVSGNLSFSAVPEEYVSSVRNAICILLQ